MAAYLSDKNLEKIYSTDYHRTQATAGPASGQLGVSVTSYDGGKLKEFAQHLLQRKESSLIVGHSNTTPKLVKLVGGTAKKIKESQYGDLFIVTVDEGEVSTRKITIDP